MSGRLHSVKAGDVIRALQRAGFVVSRTSGSHCRLVRFSDPRRQVTVPMHRGDLKLGTLRAVIRQAGFTVEEFNALL
jgi:predicted RNA binding protein YcfA (HicA-like mRNA interferase family)